VTDSLPNLPLPDQLAEVRHRLKELAARENELKAALMADPDARTGVSWIAEVKTVQTTRTDIRELKANHADIVDAFTFSVPVTRIELLGVTDDGELVSARKLRSMAQ
jgi:hypothetical protein